MQQKTFDFFKKLYAQAKAHKVVAGLVIVATLALVYYFFFTGGTTSVTYQYASVKRGVLSSTVSATGQVTPNSQVELKPKVNASVTAVYVKAGDRVKSGQVLFRLDGTDAYKQVRDAKASLAGANLTLEKLRNPKSIDVMSLNNSLKQEEESKKNEDTKVATAYKNLLNAGLQVLPDVSYTTETAPTISGSYNKGVEGQIKIAVYQGGVSGYSFGLSGIVSGTGQISTMVAQPLGDTGLYIKWNGSNPQTNWVIDIPNKQSSSYLSSYTAWQNAITSRETANAASDRNILSLKQKLDDLTPDDSNLDVRSALLTVEQRQNALLDAQQSLSDYTLTAPFDGVMASVSVDIGSSAVMASANSSTALGTIVTDKKLAQITLNESDIVKVKIGQKATVTFDAIEGLSVEGTIVEINTLGTVTSGVVTYKVKVAFNADDVRVLPNMSVSVDILTESKDNVLSVPNQAVKHDASGYYVETDSSTDGVTASSGRRLMNASSTDGIRFASSSASSTRPRTASTTRTRSRNMEASSSVTGSAVAGTLKRIPVTIGLQTDTETEITSGLREGDIVITKKTTLAAGTTTSAPSITSLLRPGRTSGTSGTQVARPQ